MFQRLAAVAVGSVMLMTAGSALAQSARPAPAEPNPRVNNNIDENDRAQEPERPPRTGVETADERDQRSARQGGPVRRVANGDKVILAFNDVSVDQIIPFIVETTGKVVMPINLALLKSRRITLVNDEPIDRQTALDMLFTAFRLNRVGVIEKDDVIILDQLEEIPRMGDLPVLYAHDDVMNRTDRGTHVIKIFALRNANAEGVGDQIRETLPDYATLTVDLNSNQIVLVGDIGLAQQVQRLIAELDKNYINVRTQTFRLAHADAAEIEANVLDLFDQLGAAQPAQRQQQRARQPAARGAQQQAAGTVGPVVEMRVTVNLQQNTVTVTAEPSIVDQIQTLIVTEWDRPRPQSTAKVYQLRYTDPVRVRELLREMLGQGGGAVGRAGAARGGAQGADVSQLIGGIYRIDAYEDTGRLVVISKTQEALDFLDHLIEQIDQPTAIGLPMVIQLRHADAVALSEELNALLQESGGGANIPRPRRGLSGSGLGGAAANGQAMGTVTRDDAGEAGRISFPWQTRTREDRGPVSAIIGSARIVPIVRQNALAILAPAAKQESIRDLIDFFDKPGRQVMISAVIAEVTTSDALSLGLRIGSGDDIGAGRFPDFGVGARGDFTASESQIFGSLFETSLLDVGFNINVFLQALARVDAVRILQQPRIFTSDNQEAEFFDGQEVSVVSEVVTDPTGGFREGFNRREVGVRLNVRPRITVEGDVDLEVILELSSVVPGTAGDRIVFDRRQTSTQVIVRDGQTIVLSGILREQESEIRRKFPILGDIPILDLIFSSRDTETTQSELIAFITPTIVARPSENDENYNILELERLRELSRPLKEIDKDPSHLRRRIIGPEGRLGPTAPTLRRDDDVDPAVEDDGFFDPLNQ